MGKRLVDESLEKIEETQRSLRDSIERTKELAAQSERLIRQHRKELDKQKD